VEVNRGCPHLCRFCAAGFVYAPPRFRSYAEIVSAVDRGLMIKKKIGLVGTAVSDHPDLIKICRYIVDRGAQAGIGSLRLDRMDEKIVDMLKAGGIETVTLAPEAGSQRLRDLLRKGITADDILNASKLLIEKKCPICVCTLWWVCLRKQRRISTPSSIWSKNPAHGTCPYRGETKISSHHAEHQSVYS